MQIAAINRLVGELETRKRTPGDAGALLALLAALDRIEIRDTGLLARFHDALLFLCAYPPTERIRRRAESLLKRFHRRVAALTGAGALDPQLDPEISGIAGTSIAMNFSFEATRWLVRRHPRQFAVDWEIEIPEDRLARVLLRLVPFLEEEAAVDANVDYVEWLRATGAMANDGGAQWLLRQMDHLPFSSRERAALYDSMGLTIRWNLGDSEVTRTRMRRPPRTIFHQQTPLLSRREVSIEAELGAAPLPVRRLRRREGEAVLEMARGAMATRYRELHGFTFGDASSCVSADAGRGFEIVIAGIVAERRLPLRAGFGVLLFRNGVPVGYADAFGVCERMEVSFNIFYSFRDGENAYCFARMLKLYRQLFGSTSFWIDPYQIGLGNDEAIEAGAFWFYRKLGFRPADPLVEAIVRREEERIASDPRHRTSPRTLRRIARSPLFHETPRSPGDSWSTFCVHNLGLAIARRFAQSGGSAAAFVDEARERVGRVLGIRDQTLLPPERFALARLAPLVDSFPDLRRWSAQERAGMREIILAKAAPREQDYLRLLARHTRFRDALLRLGSSRG
jgi:hypothetical protein